MKADMYALQSSIKAVIWRFKEIYRTIVAVSVVQ